MKHDIFEIIIPTGLIIVIFITSIDIINIKINMNRTKKQIKENYAEFIILIKEKEDILHKMINRSESETGQ